MSRDSIEKSSSDDGSEVAVIRGNDLSVLKVSGNTKITEVVVTSIDSEVLVELAEVVKGNHDIRSLTFKECKFETDAAFYLARSLRVHSNVQSISFDSCNFTAEFLGALSGEDDERDKDRESRLTSLVFDRCTFSSDASMKLKRLIGRGLLNLTLRETILGAGVLSAIGDGLQDKEATLSSIEFEETALQEHQEFRFLLDALEHSKTLRRFVLHGHTLSEAEVIALSAVLKTNKTLPFVSILKDKDNYDEKVHSLRLEAEAFISAPTEVFQHQESVPAGGAAAAAAAAVVSEKDTQALIQKVEVANKIIRRMESQLFFRNSSSADQGVLDTFYTLIDQCRWKKVQLLMKLHRNDEAIDVCLSVSDQSPLVVDAYGAAFDLLRARSGETDKDDVALFCEALMALLSKKSGAIEILAKDMVFVVGVKAMMEKMSGQESSVMPDSELAIEFSEVIRSVYHLLFTYLQKKAKDILALRDSASKYIAADSPLRTSDWSEGQALALDIVDSFARLDSGDGFDDLYAELFNPVMALNIYNFSVDLRSAEDADFEPDFSDDEESLDSVFDSDEQDLMLILYCISLLKPQMDRHQSEEQTSEARSYQ